MFSILPKDDGVFDFFERAAANVHKGAELLEAFLTHYDDIENRARQIRNVEHAGDELTRESMEMLNKAFITPFDREEIHALISQLDDILDLIEDTVNRMVLYRVTAPTEDAKQLAQVLVKCSKIIVEIMPALREIKNPRVILLKCQELKALESEADRIEQHGLAALFNSRQDPIDVIKWKDIYADLENATDRCDDVANVVEAIVMRHS